MLDTKGPEIRTGLLRDNKPIDLTAGQELLIVTDYSIEGDSKRIACSYKSLPQTVAVGGTIFIADGSITCEVSEIFEVIIIIPNNKSINERTNLAKNETAKNKAKPK